jgi:undecaprenyl-diphosphatase
MRRHPPDSRVPAARTPWAGRRDRTAVFASAPRQPGVTAVQALTLGVVQGLTEFLPISSSGHLILVPVLLGWPDQGLAFDAMIHLGTALALCCYFARDLGRLAAGALARRSRDAQLAIAITLGSLPAGLAGLLAGDVVESVLRSAEIVALSLIGWGLILWWADRQAARARVRDVGDVGLGRSLVIGCAQALALVPGTSRSGVTISAGLFAGLDRPTAARFAFLLGLPITAAAGLFKARALVAPGWGADASAADPAVLGLGFVAAFAAGLAAVWFLVRYLTTRRLTVFVVYRIALGLLILALVR